MCAHQGSGLWAVGAWRTSGHCCLEWAGKQKAAKALPGPRGEGGGRRAGPLGWREPLMPGAGCGPLGTSTAPGCRSHASLLCCRSDTSMPPSVNSLVSVSDLTLAWWVILHPFSQPQTFHLTQVRGVRSTQVASTPLSLFRGRHGRHSIPTQDDQSCGRAHLLFPFLVEGSRKAHRQMSKGVTRQRDWSYLLPRHLGYPEGRRVFWVRESRNSSASACQ